MAFFQEYFIDMRQTHICCFIPDKTFFLCSSILNLLENKIGSWPYRGEFKKSLISLIFYYLLNHYESNVEVFTDANMEKQHEITLMLRYIQDHYSDLTLPMLSHAFGYSTRQMDRILVSYTQKSFQDNLQDVRMRLAKSWLKEEKGNVETIAEQLGYSTTNSFRKIFKKYYGLSPKQYQMQKRFK